MTFAPPEAHYRTNSPAHHLHDVHNDYSLTPEYNASAVREIVRRVDVG